MDTRIAEARIRWPASADPAACGWPSPPAGRSRRRCRRSDAWAASRDCDRRRKTWDRCYDFSNIFAKKLEKYLAFLTQIKAKLCKKIDHSLGFCEKTPFFSPKIVENRRKL
jgi:hypothetical protein